MSDMAIAVRHDLLGCDGFRVESEHGLIGWVEETWLGPARDPDALAIRTVDGRRGLLLADEVESVVAERELVHMAGDGRLLELDVPRFETASADGRTILAASWHTTGVTLEPPRPPGPVQRALLSVRPWRLAAPPTPMAERPLWQIVAVLYICLALIVGIVIGLSFVAARLFAGSPY
jgi:hypothetical protein